MKKNPSSSLRRRLMSVVAALGVAGLVAIAPAAQAAETASVSHSVVAAPASTSLASATSLWPSSSYGQVIWSSDVPTDPRHDPRIAVIPLCNPFALVSWLYENFSDHGRDIAAGLRTGNLLGILAAIPQYAYADAKFHIPATLVNLGGCLKFTPGS